MSFNNEIILNKNENQNGNIFQLQDKQPKNVGNNIASNEINDKKSFMDEILQIENKKIETDQDLIYFGNDYNVNNNSNDSASSISSSGGGGGGGGSINNINQTLITFTNEKKKNEKMKNEKKIDNSIIFDFFQN